jgi:peptide/nickel transport system permease protein
VILLTYIVIGLLDSMHFRYQLDEAGDNGEVHYSVEVLSVLDVIAGPMRTQVEKSFSAPFSAHLFTRETLEQEDGSQLRLYPRLEYGGKHLEDPDAEITADVLERVFLAGIQAVAVSIILLLLVTIGHRNKGRAEPFADTLKAVVSGETHYPWHVVLGMLFMVILLLMLIINFSASYHVLGTDKVGQDVLYQALKSIRTGLVIGTLTTLVMLPFAVFLGILAGYARGWVDDVIQYTYTTLISIPGILLIAAAILMIQVYIDVHPETFETTLERADIRLLFLCIILGIMSWTGLCRLLRGESLKLREVDYIQAATAFGVSHVRIISRHILPNVMHLVLIAVVLDFSALVLAEAVLSYIGIGVDQTTSSWGNMINSARLEMAREPVVWWSLMAAFIFMFVLVLAANLFSDAVRDAFDPRLRQR